MTRTDTLWHLIDGIYVDLATIRDHVSLADAGTDRDLRLVAETLEETAKWLRVKANAATVGLFEEAHVDA